VSAYPAGVVARRIGVAVTTLRTWHQRYGLGPSGHAPGHHRRYTDEDVERLEAMQRLIVEGVAPGEAARWVSSRAADLSVGSPRAERLPAARGAGRAALRPEPHSAARGIGRAALRLDYPAVRRRITETVRDLGVVDTWESVLCPVLVSIGERHAATGRLIEVEHLLSHCICEVLGAVPRPPAPARILLACGDEEQHSLPIEALAAALAAEGQPTRMLGARVPPGALMAAVRRTGPAAMLVWSHHESTAHPAHLLAAASEHRPLLVAAAGPGWSTLPPGIARPATLRAALAMLVSAVG
jgi:DNA-binding transcriptional MerR regulator